LITSDYFISRKVTWLENDKRQAGQWKPAEETVLKNRPKLKARRSLANSSDSAEKPSLFGSFSFNLSGSGGGGLNLTPPTASPFGGLNFGVKSSDKTNGTSKVEKVVPVPRVESTGPSAGTTGSPVSMSKDLPKSDNTKSMSMSKDLPKSDNTKSSTNKDLRLEEITAAKLRLLQEKDRIEKELKNLELEESQLKDVQSNNSVSLVPDKSNTEEPELPPEEPWN
ncbi:unnamed protein product, partial [Allacma fusca]